MTDYDAALEQYKNETGGSEQEFKKNIEEHGQDYVTYYLKRWHEVMAGY